jgi:thiamine biosynthesis lipoprotein
MGAVLQPECGGLTRHTFEAMGVTVELLLDGSPAGAASASDEAEREIRRLERIFSRFDPDSELSALNESGILEASAELVEVVSLALAARTATGGRFDPTVHDAVVAAGYDRSFDDLVLDGPFLGAGAVCDGRVTITERVITLGARVRLDLGGIAKGYAADRTCALLARTAPCIVNIGGDLAIAGRPAAGVWSVAVDLPAGSLTLGLARGALATSGVDHRRWRRGGIELHHLIDPRTGLPSVSDLLRVTAFAETAAGAEVNAKTLLLAGEAAARAEAESHGIPAVLLTRDGRVAVVGGLA